jgi:hypothetical protein
VEAMQAPGVLHESALSRDWHREEERVEASVVEALADVTAGRKDEPLFV